MPLRVRDFDPPQGLFPRKSRSRPVVSVCMPVCRRRDGMTLAAARSVLDQTMSDLELVIVDDGSNDGLLDELLELHRSDDRVSLIRYDRNSGLPALRINSAILRASADIIGYQFEDDLYEPTCLETLLKYRPSDGDFMVYGIARAMFQNAEGEWVEQRQFGASPYNFGKLYGDNYIANNSVLNSRSLFDRLGLYDPHIVMRRSCDYDLWVRFCREIIPIWCQEVVSIVRVYDKDSIGSNVDFHRGLAFRYRDYNRTIQLLPKNIGDFDVLSVDFTSSR